MKAAFKRRRRVIQVDGPDPIDMYVGGRLRELRRRQKISQGELGSRLGVTFQAVQKYESGNIRIAASTLFHLGRALGVEPGYFFEGYSDSPPAERGAKKRQR
jgi:transcriptional regulator with XRE-family HTH domain